MSFEVKGVGEGWRGYELPSEPRQHLRAVPQRVCRQLPSPPTWPVEQPKKFALVIDVKTAKALGFTKLPSLLVPAERVPGEIRLAGVSATSGTRLDLTAEGVPVPLEIVTVASRHPQAPAVPLDTSDPNALNGRGFCHLQHS